MRSTVVIALIFLPTADPAGSSREQPEAGASLLVEIRPGGGTATFNSPTEAQAACIEAGGGFGLSNRQFVCVNPRRPLRSTRAGPPSPTAPAAPQAAEPTADGTAVESVTLRPGERVSFTLAPGASHQLLRRGEPEAAGAITIVYELVDGASRIVATSRTGHPLTFRLLADPDGNGGFSPVGEIALPGDGTTVTRSWPGSLGAISVGSFVRG